MEIDIDEEFQGDFKLTADAYAKKYMQITSQKNNPANYG